MHREAQNTDIKEKTLIIGIEAPYNRALDIESYFEEFENLVKTVGADYDEFIKIKIRDVDPATFIGKGNLQKLAEMVEEKGIDQIIISEPLSLNQERNLKDFLKCPVFDRTRLILEIFDNAATTAEGKLQVEIAKLRHKKSRLTGFGVHMSQQEGRIGSKGPGETIKEATGRYIDRFIDKCKRELAQLAKTRETQRKQRLTRQVPQICLIGYTNAGKSTILNLLTKSNVLAEDKLFATLDTTTRELYIDKQKIGVLSDTVGFIQALPHNLIDAFKSTLSELQYADLLLQIVDISDKNWKNHIKVVFDVLEELEVNKPMLFVFNKADRINIEEKEGELAEYQPHVVVSSLTKDGIKPLLDYILKWKQERDNGSK